ncbi:MAG: hypothetical protein KBD15_01710 [Candidatus Magasanikbacteria bacterium]|nr:hypothetical protein [Candidatus Magasanikbacteria bacterium]
MIFFIGILIFISIFLLKIDKEKFPKFSHSIENPLPDKNTSSVSVAETHAEYFVANQTLETITIQRKTSEAIQGGTKKLTIAEPNEMIQLLTIPIEPGIDPRPSNIFSDIKIFANNVSEDPIYFGVLDSDWLVMPSDNPTRKRYSLFIGPQRRPISANDCTLLYDTNGTTFTYPCTWEILSESSEKFILVSSPRKWYTVRIPAPTFEEYENQMKKNFNDQYDMKETQLMLDEKIYTGKVFSHHGGIEYIFEVHGNYIGIWAEQEISEKIKGSLSILFNSLYINQ